MKVTNLIQKEKSPVVELVEITKESAKAIQFSKVGSSTFDQVKFAKAWFPKKSLRQTIRDGGETVEWEVAQWLPLSFSQEKVLGLAC
mgnify:CR=1 FL=1